MRRCAHAQVPGLWSPEEFVRAPGTGVMSGCEVPGMGAGNQSLVLYESSKHSLTAGPSLQAPFAYLFHKVSVLILYPFKNGWWFSYRYVVERGKVRRAAGQGTSDAGLSGCNALHMTRSLAPPPLCSHLLKAFKHHLFHAGIYQLIHPCIG